MSNIPSPSNEDPPQVELETKPAIQQLLEYEKQGFVFHGSPSPNITELEPRQANEVNPLNTFSNDTAIFATPSPTASVIFACMAAESIPKEIRDGKWGVSAVNGKNILASIPKKWQPFVTHNKGYVYILQNNSFKGDEGFEKGWIVKSKQKQIPVAKVEVSFADFELLGGSIEWTDD